MSASNFSCKLVLWSITATFRFQMVKWPWEYNYQIQALGILFGMVNDSEIFL